VPTKKLENKMKLGQNTEAQLIEWEKNQVKPLFKEFDKDKKGITKDKLVKIMERLATDSCCIGKIPNVDESCYTNLFKDWPTSATGTVTWESFREGMNSWEWRMVDREDLEEMVADFFAQA
jgi:Ca2+-binding EF-hand superfamily protein